uniref:Uncharacterized protein n=1 Tax=Setaria viridis TaxID=4556 RepID=A0A4U6VUZ7_SETVI|nr:hypothetical protein SEVIR_2G195150v2 [Setaria viridis]
MSEFKETCVLYERSSWMADDVGVALSCVWTDGRWNTRAMNMSFVQLRGAESARFSGRAARTFFRRASGDPRTTRPSGSSTTVARTWRGSSASSDVEPERGSSEWGLEI